MKSFDVTLYKSIIDRPDVQVELHFRSCPLLIHDRINLNKENGIYSADSLVVD
mgnify:FL=1